MSRGILYMLWGSDPKYERALERSRASLAKYHPELPIEIERIEEPDPYQGLRHKPTMADRSPFDETLFLDTDTVVLGRLDFAFEKAQRFGIACSINECPWARRYAGLTGDIIEYNTGVLFFTRAARPVFETWKRLTPQLDASSQVVSDGQHLGTMPFADQCAFTAALEEEHFNPFVLPLNWNYRPQWQRSFFGPIRIWHAFDDPPQFYSDAARYYETPGAIIQYVELK